MKFECLHKTTIKRLLQCGLLAHELEKLPRERGTGPAAFGQDGHESVAHYGTRGAYSLPNYTLDPDAEQIGREFAEKLEEKERSLVELSLAVDKNGENIESDPTVDGDPPGAIFAGRLDRLVLPNLKKYRPKSHTGQVFDWKFGHKQDEFEPEVMLYVLLAWAFLRFHGFPVRKIEFTYQWIRLNRSSTRVFRADAMPDVWDRLLALRENLLTIPAQPTPGPWCWWGDGCPVALRLACPLVQPSLTPLDSHAETKQPTNPVGTISSPATAALRTFFRTGLIPLDSRQVIAQGVSFLASLADKGKALLKEDVIKNGPIPFGESEWTVTEYDGDRWDMAAALRIIRDAKLTWPEQQAVLKIDKFSVRRLAKTRRDVVGRLYAEARIKGDTIQRLVQRKKGAPND